MVLAGPWKKAWGRPPRPAADKDIHIACSKVRCHVRPHRCWPSHVQKQELRGPTQVPLLCAVHKGDEACTLQSAARVQ